MGPEGALAVSLEQLRCPIDQILLERHPGYLGLQGDGITLVDPDPQLVADIENDEQRLQLVVAIGATAVDVQKQVQLGRRRPGDWIHCSICHS